MSKKRIVRRLSRIIVKGEGRDEWDKRYFKLAVTGLSRLAAILDGPNKLGSRQPLQHPERRWGECFYGRPKTSFWRDWRPTGRNRPVSKRSLAWVVQWRHCSAR